VFETPALEKIERYCVLKMQVKIRLGFGQPTRGKDIKCKALR